jgi:acyl-CoA synthetase (AMP-forming)/AMP-acid ligase II
VQHPAGHAVERGDHPALIVAGGGPALTYRELDDASNRVARLLRARGLGVGDHVAVLLPNRAEWYPIVWGAMRSGIYVTPVNWHLTAAEAGYIVRDCGAQALFADAAFAEVIDAMGDDLDGVATRVAVGGRLDGFEPYEEAVAGHPAEPIADQCEGTWMLYSSGTTGRPKGIKPADVGKELGATNPFSAFLMANFGFNPGMRYLSPAPLYHAAPAGWTTMAQRLGGTVVLMEQFDALEFLRLVEEHRITHTQVVPTHLIRMLKLSDEERARYDLSSLETLVHSAAPCPPDVKAAVIEWLGPVVYELYGGSEGVGLCTIGPEEWLAHRGSVGQSRTAPIHIVGEDGQDLPPGEVGEVWFESISSFEYHGDPEKTAAAYNEHGWSTLGDIGHLDEDGYLYLSDRVGNTIISGGVNIYPREVEDVLVGHPLVDDVAVVGRPDPEMVERVVAYVQLPAGQAEPDGLAADLIAYSRERLSHFKCPREVHVVESLPRLPTGKLLKRLLPS